MRPWSAAVILVLYCVFLLPAVLHGRVGAARAAAHRHAAPLLLTADCAILVLVSNWTRHADRPRGEQLLFTRAALIVMLFR